MKTFHRNCLLPISVLSLSKEKPVPIPCKTKLQGRQAENGVMQPLLMRETHSDSGTNDSNSDSVCGGEVCQEA